VDLAFHDARSASAGSTGWLLGVCLPRAPKTNLTSDTPVALDSPALRFRLGFQGACQDRFLALP